MRKAFWKKESTFRRFHDKPIKIDKDVTHVLLSEFVKETKQERKKRKTDCLSEIGKLEFELKTIFTSTKS